MKIISIANKKGGVGKTTTAYNLAAGLSKAGKKVLAIDLDSQTNFSSTAKADPLKIGIYEVLCDGELLTDAIQKGEDFDFIAADKGLSGASKKLPPIGPELTLKKALNKSKKDLNYDYLIVDTPPNLEVLTCNALVVSDSVIIPTTVETYALDGMIQLYEALEQIKDAFGREIPIDGILLGMYDTRLSNTKTLLPAFISVAENIGTKIYDTKIRKNIALAEAQTSQKSIFDFKPDSPGAEDFEKFVKEFLKEEVKNNG